MFVLAPHEYRRRRGACTRNLAPPAAACGSYLKQVLTQPGHGLACRAKKFVRRGHPAHRRKSGKQYSTPVGADRTQDGFIIPLAYGTRVDWLQNVLAAGQATVSAEGETHDVTEPEVIDAATALPMLSPKRRRIFERVGIAQYLKVKLA
jgi:hypothetical protein